MIIYIRQCVRREDCGPSKSRDQEMLLAILRCVEVSNLDPSRAFRVKDKVLHTVNKVMLSFQLFESRGPSCVVAEVAL